MKVARGEGRGGGRRGGSSRSVSQARVSTLLMMVSLRSGLNRAAVIVSVQSVMIMVTIRRDVFVGLAATWPLPRGPPTSERRSDRPSAGTERRPTARQVPTMRMTIRAALPRHNRVTTRTLDSFPRRVDVHVSNNQGTVWGTQPKSSDSPSPTGARNPSGLAGAPHVAENSRMFPPHPMNQGRCQRLPPPAKKERNATDPRGTSQYIHRKTLEGG